jgi:hypothetical protein
MAPLRPSILTGSAALLQATLVALNQPKVSAVPGVCPTEDGAAQDLECLLSIAATQSFARPPATEAARHAILQEFVTDLQQRGRPLEQAQPADVLLYLFKWAKKNGTYRVGGLRYVAPTTMQSHLNISHLKVLLARYPCFSGPWQPTGTGMLPSAPPVVCLRCNLFDLLIAVCFLIYSFGLAYCDGLRRESC